VTGALVNRVTVEGRRAVGVSATVHGVTQEFRADGEVILSAGALMSPAVLERSGIGAASRLRDVGIDVVLDSPGVGEHMVDHRLLMNQYDVNIPYSHNPHLHGWRLVANVLRYYLTRTGAMAHAYGLVGAFARALPESATPDIEILMSPIGVVRDGMGTVAVDPNHSIELFGYVLRSRSEGWVHVRSRDPADPPRIQANYLTDPYDCAVTIAMHRYIRRLMQQPAMAAIATERAAGRALQTDDQILTAYRTSGNPGFHACGTCRMGDFSDAVLNSRLRVKGVDSLRVVDISIMPTMVSANTNGPAMATAWRAANLIREDAKP
jgi:choline dehydrogenase-like flavoprotein